MFGRRTAISFFIMSTLFLSCILRITIICSKDYSTVYANQNYYNLKISNLRGTVFDRNMIPITNNIKKYVAAVTPTPRAITAISSVLKGDELMEVLNELKKGKPVVCDVPEKINCDGIFSTEIFVSDRNTAKHTIGYCNNDGMGVMGIEKAYEDVLNQNKDIYLQYECDGKGNILEGVYPTLNYNTKILADGVKTTIDINLQNIAEEYANYIEKGAIVIAEAKSGKIRACVSRPDINLNNINNSLENENSPFVDRSINAYNVGSVFKPCVAIAGIENKKNNFLYECTGSCEIIDRVFKCHNREGHGTIDLKNAVAQSCNTFFYNFSFNVGEENIYKTASNLLFGRSIKLCNGIKTATGTLPKSDTLKNRAQLANFSIGQGELTLSPISILTLYCSIANEGVYNIPSLTEGIIKNGQLIKNASTSPTRVMSKRTSDIIKEYLKEVLISGTGIDATPQKTTAAGKTATAQTGKFDNGTEICSGWFCGFFPFENPEYVVVVFSEDTRKQTKTCSQIFSEIADRIIN